MNILLFKIFLHSKQYIYYEIIDLKSLNKKMLQDVYSPKNVVYCGDKSLIYDTSLKKTTKCAPRQSRQG